MAIKYFLAQLIRSQSTLIYFSFSIALLDTVNALIPGADFFEQQQPQVCQVYTIVESPIIINTFVPSNTVLSNPACGCEITVSNAPTNLLTTVTVTTTLAPNSLATSSTNPRFPAGTSLPKKSTFYISIDDTQNQKRHSHYKGKFLTRDGTLTSDTSQAVQVFESSGRLYNISGAASGTYFTDVNVGFMTFEPKSHSSLTPNSIAGYFKLGSNLVWEHNLFNNSIAIFALSADGLVQAIFDGKVPAGTNVIGLVLTRVGNQNAVSSIKAESGDDGTTAIGISTTLGEVSTTPRPINGVPPVNTLAVQSSLAPLSSSVDRTILTVSLDIASTSSIAEPVATTESMNEASSTTSGESISASPNTDVVSPTLLADKATSAASATSTPAISESPDVSSLTSPPKSDYTSTSMSLSSIPTPSSTPIPSSATSDTLSSTGTDKASISVSLSSIPTTSLPPASSSPLAEAASPTSSFKAAHTSASLLSTSSSLPSCSPLSPPTTLPLTLGPAHLATPPHSNNTYTTLSTAFTLTFPLLTPGSPALSEINPATAPLDSILYYQLPLSLTIPTPTCISWGYLFHQQSGLCLTALPTPLSNSNSNATSSPIFEGGGIVLEKCNVCEALPQENQLFCAVQEDGSLGKWFCVGFMGDDAQGVGYGVLYEVGAVDAVLEEGGGDCIYVASF